MVPDEASATKAEGDPAAEFHDSVSHAIVNAATSVCHGHVQASGITEAPQRMFQMANVRPGQKATLRYQYTGTIRNEQAPGRNDPCACGSGKKFKKCCASKKPHQPPRRKSMLRSEAGTPNPAMSPALEHSAIAGTPQFTDPSLESVTITRAPPESP